MPELIARAKARIAFLSLATLIVAAVACSLPGQAPDSTATPAPSATATVDVTQTPSPSPTDSGPTPVVNATPSYIPITLTPIPPTPSIVPTVSLSAKVCPTCESLRVRASPGTAGQLIEQLPPNTTIAVISRTADGLWLQVVPPDGRMGWGWANFIVTNGDVNTLPITGQRAANAPTGTRGPTDLPTGAPLFGDIVTGVTSTSRQIFLRGQAKGNLPGVFTRIGDSLTATSEFLTPMVVGKHDLAGYGALDIDLSFFSQSNGVGDNSFSAASLAARNNWTTRDVLSPDNVPSGLCQAGETTVSCQYRLAKPSVALILIGTNDAARDVTPDEFQGNLQTIVQASIDMGVIPVLTTLPPKHLDAWNNSRVDQFNGIIVAVAHANDVPLYNLWLALQTLPNQGIHQDGVHLNTPPDGNTAIFDTDHLNYGYTVRNLTALQVLDTLRRQVLYGGGGIPVANALTPLPTVQKANAPNSCNNAPLPRLTVGGKGRVTPGLPNKMRAGPHANDTIIGNIPAGGVFSVIGGPVCGDGYRWWQVTYNGLNGWTADGSGTEVWLAAAS
ncbi:MAG TPA: SH3 domain-containing protein [Aggregatilineales bacterium]|nr:SH3 domain-containing protein [Aggregatilineales bacterium]